MSSIYIIGFKTRWVLYHNTSSYLIRLCSVRNRRLLIFQSGEAFAHFLTSEAKAFIIYQHQLTGAGLVSGARMLWFSLFYSGCFNLLVHIRSTICEWKMKVKVKKKSFCSIQIPDSHYNPGENFAQIESSLWNIRQTHIYKIYTNMCVSCT